MESARIDEAEKMQGLGFTVDMEVDTQGMIKFRYKKSPYADELANPNAGGKGEGLPMGEDEPLPEDILAEGERQMQGEGGNEQGQEGGEQNGV